MYLFDKCGTKVEVYSLTENLTKVKQYKEIELYKMHEDNKFVYCAKTNSAPILELHDSVYENELNYNVAGKYHTFYFDCYKPEFIRGFIEGAFNNNRIVQILNEKNKVVRYLLITQSYSPRLDLSLKDKSMFNILEIPKSLYLLQMLQQGNFDILKGMNIDKQLQLFELSKNPIDEFNYNEFSSRDVGAMNIINSNNLILERKRSLDSRKRNK